MSNDDPRDPNAADSASFEDSMRQLAAIVEQLERGDLPLERSVELFEAGMRIARRSQQQLDQAEKRVEELLAVTEDGQPITRDISNNGNNQGR